MEKDIRLNFRSMGKLTFLDVVNVYNNGEGLDYPFLERTGLTTIKSKHPSIECDCGACSETTYLQGFA